MAGSRKFTVGADFGTDSVRTILVDIRSGEMVASGSCDYALWSEGAYCNPDKNQFRQHPEDHITSFQKAMEKMVRDVPESTVQAIAGLSIASTGSTPVAVDRQGIPLALLKDFKDNPNAMFILWKDHTSIEEATEINALAHSGRYPDFTKYIGGQYSSEWFWAKILHILRIDEKVRKNAYSWVEHCDWIPALLTGNTNPLRFKRSRCSAGHKAMWHPDWNGLPPNRFWSEIDPLLSGIRSRLYDHTFPANEKAGMISPEWAEILGIPKNVCIGVGSLDAHMGAIGAEIKPGYLVKVIGTSTCDMLTVPLEAMNDNIVKGICGQVIGSILPDMVGLEAGQSAFGDIYGWFKNLLMWNVKSLPISTTTWDEEKREEYIKDLEQQTLHKLNEAAQALPLEATGIIGLDWMNGRRTPHSNQSLKGALLGLTLSSGAPGIYKALVEATCFGSKKIMDTFLREGVEIKGVIATGGVAHKSDYVMQTLADILNYPIDVIRSEYTCALGAAMSAALVAGEYARYSEAQCNMGSGVKTTYHPNPEKVGSYQKLYDQYAVLADFVEAEYGQSQY